MNTVMSITAHNSSEYLRAIYEVDGPESLARNTAESICCDQTIEAERYLLPPALQSTILGAVEDLQATDEGRFQVTIRFCGDLLSGECSDLLNVLFGTSSLRRDVTLRSFMMTNGLLASWPGPPLGIEGLRQAVGGRIGPERLDELRSALGRETIVILGSRIQRYPGGLVAAMKEFHCVLEP